MNRAVVLALLAFVAWLCLPDAENVVDGTPVTDLGPTPTATP